CRPAGAAGMADRADLSGRGGDGSGQLRGPARSGLSGGGAGAADAGRQPLADGNLGTRRHRLSSLAGAASGCSLRPHDPGRKEPDMISEFAPPSDKALPIWPVAQGAPIPAQASAGTWPAATGFTGRRSEICLLPDAQGGLAGALFGLGDPAQATRERLGFARAAALPEGDWYLAAPVPDP